MKGKLLKMPQLDPTWFVSQIFWLIVMFGILYILMSKVALPPVDKVLEDRQKRIEDDIRRATELKEEAEAALKNYEDALKGANAEARKIIADAKDEMAALSAKKDKELTEKLAHQVKQSEEGLEKAKAAALKEVRKMSLELATAMVEKLTGVKPSAKDIEDASDKILKENKA